MAIINVQGISKSFGKTEALKRVDLEIGEGEFFGCFGPNGAGKTTLLRILSGQLEPSDGTATILGIDAKEKPLDVKKVVGIQPRFHQKHMLGF